MKSPTIAVPPSPGSERRIHSSSLFAMHALNTGTSEYTESLPDDMTAADICVDVVVNLDKSEDKEKMELAEKVKATTEQKLRQYYTGEQGKAKYRLKIYVVRARRGSAVNAVTFGTVGGAAEECLEWFLQLADGSKNYRAGRVGDKETVLFNQERKLACDLPSRLVQEIVDQIGIPIQAA